MKKHETKYVCEWADISGNGNDLVQEIDNAQPILDEDYRESLTIGKYKLSKNQNGNLWIQHENGEGMEITIDEFGQFFADKF